jgi:hypothetical protein
MAERIGAQYSDIEGSANQFDFTGELATLTGSEASGHAGQMQEGLDALMQALARHFEELAADLQSKVDNHRVQLEGTDWQGASKLNAEAAEAALRAETDRILTQSLEQVRAFGDAMHAKAESFRGAIETEFMTAMTATEHEYLQLASASRAFARNLAAADETIRYS